MRMMIAAVLILLLGSTTYAVVGGGDIILKNPGGDVLFSHENHAKTSELKCQECHDKLFLTTKKRRIVNMKEMEIGLSCGSCHDGNISFDVRENCEECHANPKLPKEGN